MTFYISKEFNLYDFEAWSGGLAIYRKLEDLDALEEAEEYIAECLANQEYVTETDVNDFLWFEMDDFIEELETESDEKLLLDLMEAGLDKGYLYAYNFFMDNLELVSDGEDDYVIRYEIREAEDIYIDNDMLYIVNRYLKQVNLFKPQDGQVIYFGNEAL